ncbi:PucR family transcriptional regulator [Mycobacterium intermedium]|nr:PucR family transcriptional regulator [Mycobacterium intermedium]
MPDPNRCDEAAVTETAAAVVDRLAARLPSLTRAVVDTLTRGISELPGDAQLMGLLAASTAGNVDTVFRAFQHDIPIDRVEPPTAALEYARRLAQRGVPMHAMVRAYRLGHQAMVGMIADEVRTLNLDPALGRDVFEWMTEVTFRYIDWISQQVVEVYEAERDLWLENRSRVRAVRVAEILTGGDVDVDAMTTAIGYPLRRTHLALIPWLPDDSTAGNEIARLERYLNEIADTAQASNALFIAADRLTGWGWIALGADAGANPIGRIRALLADKSDGPRVALGTALPGVDGFRRSHGQAQNARRVAIAAGSASPRIVAASEPGLTPAALLSGDIGETRAWVRETLGPLANDSKNDRLLRETLRVFLREGGSYKAAAEELNLHFNSVKYRVQRAISRRGCPIEDDRLDVELALLVCHRLGTAVLEG